MNSGVLLLLAVRPEVMSLVNLSECLSSYLQNADDNGISVYPKGSRRDPGGTGPFINKEKERNRCLPGTAHVPGTV